MNYNSLFANVFKWMFIGLLVSFATSYYISSNPVMVFNLFGNNTLWFVIILEFVLVIALSAFINKMNYMTAIICFLLYCFASGLTLSIITYSFSVESVFYVFMVTALLFGVLSFVGYKTKKDLTKMGTILYFSLIAVILVILINIFIGSDLLSTITSIVIILIFIGLTVYDIQKIKRLKDAGYDENKLGIIGALELYLDFINIFINLMKLFGKEK